jgi:hypothetical protein
VSRGTARRAVAQFAAEVKDGKLVAVAALRAAEQRCAALGGDVEAEQAHVGALQRTLDSHHR